ncbi:hypothetical protein ZIOFF_051460 [Zingiber officinale]|uniref:Retrotransposon gag domain-containing protein n=1 Tax=Zingiber officinale TaxID=94328 RepID=A0A8J5FST5_ZINOF|nr:hypothetical protein ZIOFF_051460 [Zingiber officinale]
MVGGCTLYGGFDYLDLGFKEVFYGKYFTTDGRTRLAKEFLELQQGDMTVTEYVKKFERGQYFVESGYHIQRDSGSDSDVREG